MKPLISVIMPVYNNERYFPNAVESVLNQSFKNFELIIIDDGSTDNTPQIADSFAKKDDRVKVIHQENQWIFASLNNGVEAAMGEYVYVLNSDDSFTENALTVLAGIAKKYNPDVIWTRIMTHKCDSMQNIVEYDIWENKMEERFYSNETEVRENYIYYYKYKLSHNQANLYKTSIAKKHKLRNDIYGADKLFNICIANDVKTAYICYVPIYNHFRYESPKMNVSAGKYYSYEHKMFNEFHTEYIKRLTSWGVLDKEAEDILVAHRFTDLTVEYKGLSAFNCHLTIDEKVKTVFIDSIDDIVYNCALKTNRIEEMEARVLSACNELFAKEPIGEKSEFYFVYEMLHALLKYEKTDEDMQKIKSGVFHEKNPHNIGKSFYEKLF